MNGLLLAGSLAGVLVLAVVAWLLGLGGGAIADEAEAMRIAGQAASGFEPEAAIVSGDRRAAIVRGTDASIVLLKVHGAHVATRRLSRPLAVEMSDGALTIATGERMFGDVRFVPSAEDRDRLATFV
ncbi:MAG: hypothetical protein ACXWU1_00255 [Allosphingosinicella sp.]